MACVLWTRPGNFPASRKVKSKQAKISHIKKTLNSEIWIHARIEHKVINIHLMCTSFVSNTIRLSDLFNFLQSVLNLTTSERHRRAQYGGAGRLCKLRNNLESYHTNQSKSITTTVRLAIPFAELCINNRGKERGRPDKARLACFYSFFLPRPLACAHCGA